jgi:hypothetical protein
VSAFDAVRLGIRRHPLRYARMAGGTFGALWTAIEATAFFLGDAPVKAQISLGWVALISAVVGLFAIAQKRSITLRIGAGNTTLHIYFGDLFAASGHKVIPANEYFDSELGQHVARTSVHGKAIERYFSGRTESLDAAVDASLRDVSAEAIPRATGRSRRYPIGTTAVIATPNEKLFVVAFCHTDLTTLKASATVLDLWTALDGLWEKVRVETHGQPVTLPLIGGGLGAVPLPCTALLQCIISSLHAASTKSRVTEVVQIVLHQSTFEQIDLEVVRQQWR